MGWRILTPFAAGVGVPDRTLIVPGYLNNQWGWNGAAFIQQNVWTDSDGALYAVWYDHNRMPFVGKLDPGAVPWEVFDLGSLDGNPLAAPAVEDSHHTLAVVTDGDGIVHIAGNFHRENWRSIRSDEPGDITSFTVQGSEIDDEAESSYPTWVRLLNGHVLAVWRQGNASSGDMWINRWDGASWGDKTRIIQGGGRNAYWHRIAVDSRGRLHAFLVWRSTFGADNNHDLSYMRSDDGGLSWRNSNDEIYALPITYASIEKVVETTATGSGLLNSGGADVDASGHPHAAIFLHDENDFTQIHHVWHDGDSWNVEPVTSFSEKIDLDLAIYEVEVSRPALICPANGGSLIVYRTDWADDNEWLHAIDVTTPGAPRHFRLLRYDLGQYEPSIDSGARFSHDHLRLLVTSVAVEDGGEEYVRKVGHIVSWPASLLTDEASISEIPMPPALPEGYPSEIPDLWALFDAATLDLSDEDPVGVWEDLSGSPVRNATQAASGLRPRFKTDIINGEPAVRFTGDDTEEWLRFSGPTSLPVTVVLVALRRVDTASDQSFYSSSVLEGSGSTARTYVGTDEPGPSWRAFNGTNLLGPSLDTNPHVHVAVFDGNSSRYIVDNDEATGTTGTRVPGEFAHIGTYLTSEQHIEGDIAFLAVYHRALDASERQEIIDYLDDRFDLQLDAGPLTYEEEVLADNPTHWWRFKETSGPTAADEMDNQHGTYVESPTLDEEGPVDRAIELNGVDQYVEADGAEDVLEGSSWTIELWAKTTTTDPEVPLGAGDSGDDTPTIFLQFNANTFGVNTSAWRGMVRGSGAGNPLAHTGSSDFRDGEWHHFVMTKSGNQVKLFFDGVEVASQTNSSAPSLNRYAMGALRRVSTSSFLEGMLAEVALYPTALSAFRIATHYDAAMSS